MGLRCLLKQAEGEKIKLDNTEKAKEVIKNGIKRIDRGMTSSSTDTDPDNE